MDKKEYIQLKDLLDEMDEHPEDFIEIYKDKNGVIRHTKEYVKYLGGLKN